MAGGIKLFQFLRQCYKAFGLNPPPTPDQCAPFNAKNLFLLVSLVLFLMASVAFILFAATSINECADCLYICSTCAIEMIHMFVHICKMGKMLQLIDNYEEFIKKSEPKSCNFWKIWFIFVNVLLSGLHFQAQYYAMSENIEKMTELVYVLLVKITCLGPHLPLLLASAFNYVYYGMGEDSFLLPYYVLYGSWFHFSFCHSFKN